MNKTISFYKASSIIELAFITLGLGLLFFYRKNNISDYIAFTFFYSFFLASAFTGYKIVKAIEKSIKLAEEYIIVGYILAIIKLMVTLFLLVASLYYFPISSFHKILLPYQLSMIGFMVFIVFSILNSITYFFIIPLYRKIRELNIEDADIIQQVIN